jgi:hypothetical protein
MTTKPILLFLLALLVCPIILFAQKKSKADLLADSTALVYNVNFEGEDYQFIVEININKNPKSPARLIFGYNIVGGSKNWVGGLFIEGIESLDEENIYIPGFQGQEIEGTYFVLPLALQKKILSMKKNKTIPITINNDQYILSARGVDSFQFRKEGEEYVSWVQAFYCDLNKAENDDSYGDFAVHYSDTVPVLLRLSFTDEEDGSKNFSMRLVEVRKLK